jgi:hypothetical protein
MAQGSAAVHQGTQDREAEQEQLAEQLAALRDLESGLEAAFQGLEEPSGCTDHEAYDDVFQHGFSLDEG